ncbi:MAG: hypothetical protein BroJett042_25940 [Bacteroidota bacterium]|nr:MAG: hypothetical protein UZ12_BCD005000093 [Bacteroidetes bacterium OLB12]GIL24081.1 MAG: hypothetical protein BroJett042_25940 [Bacteroidota bacterium]HNR73573.1 hypothetical protein [Cyclobacteriaceae bacterium]HNU42934.1 hypothetical protein [Cyclobacteriaceae bacterium]
MKYLPILLSLVMTSAWAQIPSAEVQIKTALMAAPEEKRSGAQVYGYSQKGELIILQKGTNELICLADDPNQKGFSVSCYHKDLEPFMARGRELKAQGKTFQEIFETREAEAKSGKLSMPKQASNLQVFSAPAESYDPATGEVTNGKFRYVVYIPWATAASTGLPTKPEAPGMPWIMDPGTHRAHIMINPVSKD